MTSVNSPSTPPAAPPRQAKGTVFVLLVALIVPALLVGIGFLNQVMTDDTPTPTEAAARAEAAERKAAQLAHVEDVPRDASTWTFVVISVITIAGFATAFAIATRRRQRRQRRVDNVVIR